jgi:hypothetical protein
MANEKWMNMTRNPRKSCPRISGFMIAKEDSDAKGVLVTINKNSSSSRKNNSGEDGGGDDDNKTLLSANTRMPNVTITD